MYDNLVPVSYHFPGVDLGSGDVTKKMPIPRGASLARVLDILAVCTTTFTQVTTPGVVKIGDGTTADKFASLTIGGLAAGSSLSGRDFTDGVFKAVYHGADYNSGAGLHDLTATFVAPTGGTPAGVGDFIVIVGFDTILK